jgi:hypothetical protein
MPLARDALDRLLDALHEQLVQRRADADDGSVELGIWLDRCAEVIRGFAGTADRDYVDARLRACVAQPAERTEGHA